MKGLMTRTANLGQVKQMSLYMLRQAVCRQVSSMPGGLHNPGAAFQASHSIPSKSSQKASTIQGCYSIPTGIPFENRCSLEVNLLPVGSRILGVRASRFQADRSLPLSSRPIRGGAQPMLRPALPAPAQRKKTAAGVLSINLRIKPPRRIVREGPESLVVPEAISHYWSMWLYVRSVSGWPLAAGGPGGAHTGSGVASLTTARLCQQAIVRAENMAFPCRHFYLQGVAAFRRWCRRYPLANTRTGRFRAESGSADRDRDRGRHRVDESRGVRRGGRRPGCCAGFPA